MIEALEVGSPVLLFDEDTSAPALLDRDALRAALMPDAHDPVVPLSALVRPLFTEHGISTILVTESAAAYAPVADTVIGLDRFRPRDLTSAARQAAAGFVPARRPDGHIGGIAPRTPVPESVAQFKGRRVRADARAGRTITIGREPIELKGAEQLVDPGQARAVGDAIVFAAESGYVDGTRSLREIVSLIDAELTQRGLAALSPFQGHPGDYARPRRHEIAAAFNRLRTLRIKS